MSSGMTEWLCNCFLFHGENSNKEVNMHEKCFSEKGSLVCVCFFFTGL